MKDLPTVRLSLLLPFIQALRREGASFSQVLEAQGLSTAAMEDPEAFVPAPVMYALTEELCDCSSDPYFGLRVGESMDPLSWPPLIEAFRGARTVHELLLMFANEPDKAFSRDDILNALRGINADLYTRSVDILVSRLRQKLKPLNCIQTVWGSGYRFLAAEA